MKAILTNLTFKNDNITDGDIVVDELKVWPGWKEHSGFIATYQWKSQPNVLRRIEIKNDKVITFKDIAEAFNTLNKASPGVVVASLTYKDGKVTLFLKPDTQLVNFKIADDIARELKIKSDKSNTGEPVDIDKIAFYNTSTIYLVCDQADSDTFINSQKAKTMLAASPFNTEVISFEPTNSTPFHAPVGQLTFRVQDERGIDLPVKRLFFCLTIINDQRLRNRENLSENSCTNSTA